MVTKPKLNQRQRPKKETERMICEQFLESHYKEKVTIYQLKRDPPDFALQLNGENISIELTMLIQQDVKQKEAAQTKIVDIAHQKFNAKSNLQLRVLVSFSNKKLKYQPSFIDERADEISESVDKICKGAPDNNSIVFRNNKRPFNEYIDTLYISGTNNFEVWQPFGAFKVPHTDNESIQFRIDEKNRKLSSYKKLYNENWLLIASNLGYTSSAMRFDLEDPQVNKMEFDKVFLFDVRSKEIWEA